MGIEDLVNEATGETAPEEEPPVDAPLDPAPTETSTPQETGGDTTPTDPEPGEGTPLGSSAPALESEAAGLERLSEATTTGGQTSDSAPTTEQDSTAPTAEPEGDQILNAILNKIAPVKDQARRRKLKILIYSDPGGGKSVLAGQAPDNLFIDCEDGLLSLDNHPDLIPDSVYAYPYKSFRGFEAVVQKLNEAPPELAHIETVTIDTISELHKRGLAEVTEEAWKNSPMANNRYVAGTDQHTENNEHIRRLVSSLRDLDRNLILLSHARTVEPKGKPAKTYPDFSEKLANTLAGIVDIVGYMYLNEVDGVTHRVLRLQGTGNIVAKTRVGGYPDELVDPTWSDLWDAFKNAHHKD